MKLIWGVAVLLIVIGNARRAEAEGAPSDSEELFRQDRVWTVRLSFTPEQWEEMEPVNRGRTTRDARGRPIQARGVGPSAAVAGVLKMEADRDGDGAVSRIEFVSAGERWFESWDREGRGALDEQEVQSGMDALMRSSGPDARRGFTLQGVPGNRNGIAAAFGYEYTYVHAKIDFEGTKFEDVAVRVKGNGTFLDSRRTIKRPLKVDLNKYVKGQKVGGVKTLNLHNGITDASWMNEVLAHRMFADVGVPAPRTAYARVYVDVPGKYQNQYLGLYILVENVDEDFIEHRSDTKKGAIFKPVTPRLFEYLGEEWEKYIQTYDPKISVSSKEKKRLLDLCRLVTEGDDAAFAERIGEFIDLDQFARYLAVATWLSDLDGLLGAGQNFYLYLHPKSEKFLFVAWDQDHSFGTFHLRGTVDQREQLSIHWPWSRDNRFLERMFKVEPFKNLYLAKMEEFSKSVFLQERLAKQVDELASVIRPAIEEESRMKLAAFERAVNWKPSPQVKAGILRGLFAGNGPEVKPIKGFAAVRNQSVIDQLAGKSKGLVVGTGRPGQGLAVGPGSLMAPVMMKVMDADEDGALTRAEFDRGMSGLFEKWDVDRNGDLTEAESKAGMEAIVFRAQPSDKREK